MLAYSSVATIVPVTLKVGGHGNLGRGFRTPHLTLPSESDVLVLHCETENGDEMSPTGVRCICEWYGKGKNETTNLYPCYHPLSCQTLPVMNIYWK